MAHTSAQRKRDRNIDENLKRVYEQVIEEDVPDRFRMLLDALKQEEQSKAEQNGR